MEGPPRIAYRTDRGQMWLGDSLTWLDSFDDGSVNLVLTSPPFALTRKLAYGNQPEDDYVAWFRKFADKVKDKLTDDGSFVIDLGGAWRKGSATRSLYQFKLLIELVEQGGFHLAEDFYWFNRAKLPGPREWVNKRRTRVKDAVNVVWWLSKTEEPKASNLNVLRPYSKRMLRMIETGEYNDGKRQSEHVIGKTWAKDQGGAIAPNVIEVVDYLTDEEALAAMKLPGSPVDNMLDEPNTTSNDPYLHFLAANELPGHPARFPRAVPEFFIKFLTDPEDLVVDIFGGSNMTGCVAEALGRQWRSCESDADYVKGSVGRFDPQDVTIENAGSDVGIQPEMFEEAARFRQQREQRRQESSRKTREARRAEAQPDLTLDLDADV